MVSDIMNLAADQLATTKPMLSARLVLRICDYDRDRALQRVLSRTRLAALPSCTATELAQLCINRIRYALPRLSISAESSRNIYWVERMRVALEVLSRLTVRLPVEVVHDALDMGLECYRSELVARDILLARPLGNILARAWEALPKDQRTGRAVGLLLEPIAGIQGFPGDDNYPDPGQFVVADDFPPERELEEENRYKELVAFLVQGLDGSDNARKRAILRLVPLFMSGYLTEVEQRDIAHALWGQSDPILYNSNSAVSPFDWVYLILPELESGQAERSFRNKWLSPNSGTQDEESAYTGSVLTQLGAAVSGLQGLGKPLEFSPEEEQRIALQIVQLVETFSATSISFSLLDIGAAIRGMASLAVEITIPRDMAEDMLGKVSPFLDFQVRSNAPFFGDIDRIRTSIAFALIPGLIKALPHKSDTVSLWLRTGLVSGDEERVRDATSALNSWLAASASSKLDPVPDDLVREVGSLIASGQSVALADALICARSVFENGSEGNKGTIAPLALMGLSLLSQKLQYDLDQDSEDGVHTLRMLCARLAIRMAQCGFEQDASVVKWLDISRNDSFPEIRNVLMDSGFESGS